MKSHVECSNPTWIDKFYTPFSGLKLKPFQWPITDEIFAKVERIPNPDENHSESSLPPYSSTQNNQESETPSQSLRIKASAITYKVISLIPSVERDTNSSVL